MELVNRGAVLPSLAGISLSHPQLQAADCSNRFGDSGFNARICRIGFRLGAAGELGAAGVGGKDVLQHLSMAAVLFGGSMGTVGPSHEEYLDPFLSCRHFSYPPDGICILLPH